MLVFEGPAGLGKTTLLHAAATQGRSRGMRVLSGAASEVERDPLAVLFRMLRDSGGTGRRTEQSQRFVSLEGKDRFALTERLFGLTRIVADNQPLLVTLDDLQWLDAPSWGLLRRIGREIEGMPIAIVGSLRLGEPRSGSVEASIRDLPWVQAVTPAGLSAEALATIVRERAGTVDPAVERALVQSAGGNPTTLAAIIALCSHLDLRSEASASAISELVPRATLTDLDRRIQQLSPGAADLALLLAAAGPEPAGNSLRRAAGLSVEELTAAIAELDAAGLVDGTAAQDCTITQPLHRVAVVELAGGERADDARLRLAEALAEGDPARAAAQLTASGQRELPVWAHRCLLSAGQIAGGRGSPEDAIAFIDRSLAVEAGLHDRAQRAEALFRRGSILCMSRDPEGIENLEAAIDLCDEPEMRGRIALALAQACFHLVRLEQAAAVSREAIAGLSPDDRELKLKLEAAALNADRLRGEGQERARSLEPEVAAARTAGERAALAHVAAEAMATGARPASEIAALASAAWAGGALLAENGADAPVVSFAGTTLAWCERFDEALSLAESQLDAGRREHSPVTVSYALALRSGVRLRLGQLADAEADAEEVVTELPATDPLAHMLCFGWLLESMVGRGRVDDAARMLAGSALTGEVPDLGTADFLLLSRGDVRLAGGKPDAALTDYEEVGRRADRAGFVNPGGFAWRSRCSAALRQLGQRERALALASAELDRARTFGAPRAVSIALREVAACTPELGTRLGMLEEAAGLLERSPARLQRARVRLDLGVALLEADRPEAGIERLEDAMDDAHHCGAEPLVQMALDTLRRCGKRPRRPAIRGLDALTPQQLRVARLAASGMSNPEIAEALFLTKRTVELHLTGAYKKLGIGSREGLTTALEGSSLSASAS
jgi:DNA-binding CsgD family transcriptional regulator